MPVRKIFLSTTNSNQSIELGLADKGKLVALVVFTSKSKRSSHVVISLHPDDALELCKEIADTVGLTSKGGGNGAG